MSVYKKLTITVLHPSDILLHPPVISLVENLLVNGHSVNLISYNITALPKKIKTHPNLHYTNISIPLNNNLIHHIFNYITRNKISQKAVKKYMTNSDILWTTTDLAVRCLGPLVLNYKYIMQLMELEEWYPMFGNTKWFKFPISKYAQKAWKIVVPEINRAYIQKTWWNLEHVPYVLPNKPYNTELEHESPELVDALQVVKSEPRRIILYLGVLGADRNLEKFAEAVEKLGKDYCLYILGKPNTTFEEKEFKKNIEKYLSSTYLGYFQAPKHLAFVKYAYIGLLPYVPTNSILYQSELNALYCAPNKIFEYSRYGVPMLGTDVPGLRQPFEQYDMGVCCRKLTVDSIIDAIREIEKRHDIMSANCKKFYDSVDLDEIVEKILYEEV